MLKKRMDERICRDCGKVIIGRRIDAVIRKDCRRKAQEESSQKIKEKEKDEISFIDDKLQKEAYFLKLD